MGHGISPPIVTNAGNWPLYFSARSENLIEDLCSWSEVIHLLIIPLLQNIKFQFIFYRLSLNITTEGVNIKRYILHFILSDGEIFCEQIRNHDDM
jgi:hypothetical protein